MRHVLPRSFESIIRPLWICASGPALMTLAEVAGAFDEPTPHSIIARLRVSVGSTAISGSPLAMARSLVTLVSKIFSAAGFCSAAQALTAKASNAAAVEIDVTGGINLMTILPRDS